MKWVAVGLIVVMLAACDITGSSTGSGSGAGNAGSSFRDSSLACDHFRHVMYDYSHRLLTEAELHDKLKEVYSDSDIATARVRSAAQAMLAGETGRNAVAFDVAIKHMDKACKATGH